MNTIFHALVLACAALLAVDFFLHRHAHFGFEGWPGFYAGYGLLCAVGLVLAAGKLRQVLMRREDYYD